MSVFAYDDEQILDDVSLQMPHGKIIGYSRQERFRKIDTAETADAFLEYGTAAKSAFPDGIYKKSIRQICGIWNLM